MISRGAHFDDTSFLVDASLRFFLNGIIYFLLVRLDILYKEVLTYLCSKIISSGDILISSETVFATYNNNDVNLDGNM